MAITKLSSILQLRDISVKVEVDNMFTLLRDDQLTMVVGGAAVASSGFTPIALPTYTYN